MSATVVKQVVVEMRGRSTQLDAELKKAEARVAASRMQMDRGNAASADMLASRQANAARAIAGATETMARQGRVGGEAIKQLIAQGANAALFFGPTGAIAGAVGISILAITQLASKAREELARLRREEMEGLNRFAALDATGQAREINQLTRGDTFVAEYQDIWAAADEERASMLARRGTTRLRIESQMLEDAVKRIREAGRITEYDRSIFAFFGFDRTEGGLSELAEAGKRITELRAASDKLKRDIAVRTPIMQSTATDEARARQAEIERAEEDRLRKRFQENPEEWARRMRTALREGFAGTAEDVRKAFDELEAYARETGHTAEIPLLVNARDRALEAAAAIERTQRELERTDLHELDLEAARTETLGGSGKHTEELARLRAQRNELRALATDTARTETERAKLLKDAVSVQARITELVGDEGKQRERIEASLAAQALALGQVLDGVLQLVDAWAGVDTRTTNVLRNIVQIATNIPNVLEKLAVLEEGKDSEGRAVTGVAGVKAVAASVIPIVGALVALGSSLFGESPAEQARRAELRKNTQAIQDLTEKAGLLGIGATGTGVAGGLSDAQRILTRGEEIRRRNEQIIRAGGRPTESGFNAKKIADELGINFGDLREIAELFGISLNKNITSIEQLVQAIEAARGKISEFGTDVDSQRRQAQAEIDIFGITDPLEALGVRKAATAGRSSALDNLTSGLDLSTAEGREQARKRAQQLFEILKAGGDTLDPAQLGSLTGDELLEAILELVASLNDVDESLGVNESTALQQDQQVSSNTQISVDQASRLLGLGTQQVRELKAIRELLDARLPLTVPSTRIFDRPVPHFPAGGDPINIESIEVHFNGAIEGGAAAGAVISDELVRAIRVALGKDVRTARLYAGKAVVS